jgi:general secretion pathway protein D
MINHRQVSISLIITALLFGITASKMLDAQESDRTVIETYHDGVDDNLPKKSDKIESAADDLSRDQTKNRMIDEVGQAWKRPQIFDRTAVTHPQEKSNRVLLKMKSIVLPRVNFNGVILSRVIDTLSALSEEYDLENDGINIVLIDPANKDPTVNIALRNLALNRVLDFTVESIGYEYDVQDDVVVVRPGSGVIGSHLETEFFPISRSTIIRLTGIGSGSGSGNVTYDPFAPTPTAVSNDYAQGGEEQALKNFLQRAGIPFNSVPGSNLALADGQLIVTSTSRLIDKVRNLLRRYSEVKQVEIETKFIEVQQSDLDELGFDWSVTGSDFRLKSSMRSLSDAFSIGSNGKNIVISRNDSLGDSGPSTTDNSRLIVPNLPPSLPNTIELGEGADEFASFTGIIGNVEVSAIIRALSLKQGTDLMSAPRVTVLSGKTAEIVVAQEMRYPESYADIQSEVGSTNSTISGGSAGITITTGAPQDFVVRNVGVEMEVTPTVEDDNSISLLLEPQVTEFEGFVEYGGPSIGISGGTTVTVPSGFFQPIFSVRRVRTEVTVWDGATVVMGGLTREEVKSVEDKVPILGDVPLLGRFFRSKGETTQKRNLLIFVTANLISPGGSPARQQYSEVEAGSLFQNPTMVTPGGAIKRESNINP